MRKILLLIVTVLTLNIAFGQKSVSNDTTQISNAKTLFIYGGNPNKTFIKYVASLTNKPNPKICYIPTATGDNPSGIATWYTTCEELPLRPYVMRNFSQFVPNTKNI